jgi:hypothetical protein
LDTNNTLRQLARFAPDQLTDAVLNKLDEELAKL